MSNAQSRPPVEENFETSEETYRIDAEERSEPTWFPPAERRAEGQESAERRHMRQEPLRTYRSGPREPEEFSRGFEPPEGMTRQVFNHRNSEPAPRPAPRRGGLGKSFVFASLAASLTGGLIGLAAAEFDAIKQTAGELAAATFASLQPAPELAVLKPATAPANRTVISKKPVATATLDVADASGALNSMIPLILRAEPAAEGQTLALRISGLPADAYLTAGTREAGNSWLLDPGQEQNLKLVVPKAGKAKFDVEIAAIETGTGELAAPVKELRVAIDDPNLQVEPANAPPETASMQTGIGARQNLPATLPAFGAEIQAASATSGTGELMRKGELLLKSGDLAAARLFYEKAYAQGAAAGALGAGKTYDPVVFADLNVQGIAADPVKAMEWYKRAEDQGVADAASAIDALKALAR